MILEAMVGTRSIFLPVVGASIAIAASALSSAGPLTIAPSAGQRTAILHAFGDPAAANGCLTVRLASASPKYATVRLRQLRSCRMWAFNGVNILERVKPAHWRVVFEGSAFRCPLPAVPRRVQRDLAVCPG